MAGRPRGSSTTRKRALQQVCISFPKELLAAFDAERDHRNVEYARHQLFAQIFEDWLAQAPEAQASNLPVPVNPAKGVAGCKLVTFHLQQDLVQRMDAVARARRPSAGRFARSHFIREVLDARYGLRDSERVTQCAPAGLVRGA